MSLEEKELEFLFDELECKNEKGPSTIEVISDKARRINDKINREYKKVYNNIYYSEHIACFSCKSTNTVITEEGGYLFIQCESCGSSRGTPRVEKN